MGTANDDKRALREMLAVLQEDLARYATLLAARITDPAIDGADLTQTALLLALEKERSLEGLTIRQVLAWLKRAMAFQARNIARKARRMGPIRRLPPDADCECSDAIAGEAWSPVGFLDRKERSSTWNRILRGIPALEVSLFLKVRLDGRAVGEAANELGIRPDMAYEALARTTQRLRDAVRRAGMKPPRGISRRERERERERETDGRRTDEIIAGYRSSSSALRARAGIVAPPARRARIERRLPMRARSRYRRGHGARARRVISGPAGKTSAACRFYTQPVSSQNPWCSVRAMISFWRSRPSSVK
ncbi:MAG: hypothetical protein JXA90_08165 [Planctomycetes bacterium]|nr:hypothetical protein [Planctomycetota bacterium]